MTSPEWKIDVYAFGNDPRTAVLHELLDATGVSVEYHNISTDAAAITAVRAMEALDGQKSPRVYMRRGVWPNMDMVHSFYDPSRTVLRTMLQYHQLIPSGK